MVKFKISKKYVRGNRSGKRFTEIIKLNDSDDIHNYLWDITDLYDRNRCNYVVEHYKQLP